MTKAIPESIKDHIFLCPESPSWLARTGRTGEVIHCGWQHDQGYWILRYKYRKYYAHRIVYYLDQGVDPLGEQIDHIDGDRANNSPNNLRIASFSQNQANQQLRRENSTGYKGVTWKRSRQKYAAQITVGGKYKYLGMWDSAVEAALAYDRAARDAFGAFALVNFPLRSSR